MTTWLQVVEVGLKYSKTIASIFVFLISLGGYGVYDFVETTEIEKNKAIREVAVGFQQVMNDIKPAEVKVTKEFRCSSCRNWWLRDIEKVKEGLENKYHK